MQTTENQLALQRSEILPQASSVLTEADEYLELSQNLLNNQYLQELDQCAALSISEDQQLKVGTDVRLFKLNRLVSEQRELMLENAMNAYIALGSQHYKVFLLLNADDGRVDLYLGAAAKPGQFSGKQAGDLLQAAFEGHFPGSELEPLEKKQTEQLLALNQQFPTCTTQAVSALSGVSSLNLEDKKQFVQGLERFIDASSNRTYTALILAEPLPPAELEKRQASLEVLATELSAMHKLQLSFGMQASEAISTSLAASFSQSVGENLSSSTTLGVNSTQTTGTSKGSSTSTNTTPSPNIIKKLGKIICASERISHTKSENYSLSNSVVVK